ncbi:MAG TPA: tetratricopeptide repeat-containing sensor histidine kinase [Gracilimonas sp.]|uniref:ATP-binding protein n=1 Tax=Gracilimonas sp. TaxID=1974203 RepID=UPI002D94AF6D|nr:tetratricopeptide repeat-containing sensor histidine kinase [Gracilimonas sp.]
MSNIKYIRTNLDRIFLKLFSLLFFFLSLPQLAECQQQDIDSLRKVLQYAANEKLDTDSTTINTLNEIGSAYRYTELDSTKKYANLALNKAKEIGYTRGLLYSNYLISTVHFNRGEYQKVYEIASASLELAGKDIYRKERALLNQLIGISYASQGSYQPGLSYFFEAINLFEQLENKHGVFQNLNNIGVSYLKLEDYEQALDIFLELDSLKTLDTPTISIPVNLGFIYYELEEYEKAEEQLMRVLNFEGGIFDQRALGLSTFKLGEIYLLKDQYHTALAYFNRSLAVYEELENELEKVQSLNGIALTHLEMNDSDQALEYAAQAFEISEESEGLPEKNRSSETLYMIYKQRGNYDDALSYHEMFKTLSDSLKNDEISREVGRLEAEYKYREQELRLREAQQQQNLDNANEVATKNIFLLITLSLFAIALIVAYAQYRNSSLRKKANNLLREKNDQIKEQARKLEEMNEIKTQLFSIISHDLRGPLSSLYGFISLTEMDELTNDQIQEILPELADKFERTTSLLNNLLNWARSQLDGYKVVPEVFNLSEQFQENQNLLSHQANKKDIEIGNDLEKKATVYADKNMINLVILNLLSNAIKFTPTGGKIKVWSESKNDTVEFYIKDNGVGISEERVNLLFEDTSFHTTDGTNNEKGTGLGLMLCQNFITKNNGDIRVKSKVGEGSTFCFSLPKDKK